MSVERRVRHVLRAINGDLDRDWTVQSVADEAGYSPYHFHRIFRGVTGETVANYVSRLRLERAAFQLVTSPRTVAEVAEQSAYGSLEAFCRRFKRAFGKTPTEFRREFQKLWHLPGRYHFGQEQTEFYPEQREWPVEVQSLPELRLAGLSHVGPYLQAATIWPELLSWAEELELPQERRIRVGICHDDPELTEAQRLRYDGCLVIPQGLRIPDRFHQQILAAGPYAVWTHRGSYEELEEVYRQLLGGWLPQSKKAIRDLPCLELYEVTPFETQEEAEWVTKVCLALAD